MTDPTAPADGHLHPTGPRCAEVSSECGEQMAGTAPRADVWVAVEHTPGWGDAGLTRSSHGVRVLMVRGRRAGGVPTSPGLDPWLGTGARVWVGYATGRPVLRVGMVDRPEDVAGWDLAGVAAGSHRQWGRSDPDPLLLICANGRRDRCCGHTGGRLADAMWRGPHQDRVLTCTHLGGHRFAPTALLLPIGALHGRLDAPGAADLLEGATTGRMRADTLRGFSTHPEPAQVAEAHVRTRTGHVGLAPLDVTLLPARDATRMHAEVRMPDGSTDSPALQVDLESETTPRMLACGRAPEPKPRWSTTP